MSYKNADDDDDDDNDGYDAPMTMNSSFERHFRVYSVDGSVYPLKCNKYFQLLVVIVLHIYFG